MRIVLTLGANEVEVDILDEFAQWLDELLPVEGELRRVGDEVFCFIESNRPLSSAAVDVFSIGDLVYWRSRDGERQAIAFFFGNTPIGPGDAPRAASDADLIGRATSLPSGLAALERDDPLSIRRV